MSAPRHISPWRRIRARWAYRRALFLRFWGHRLVQRAYYQASAAALSSALALAPDFVEAYLVRGLLYWRELQEAALAVADFSAVLRLDASRSEALFYRGMAYQALADYEAAVADLRAALRAAPEAIWWHNAHHQLVTLESILEELPPHLVGGPEKLLPPGKNGLDAPVT